MSKLDQLIAEGSDIADDAFASLQDTSRPPRTHWEALNAWHSAASDFVAAHSPDDAARIVPLEVRFSVSEVYASVDGLTRILKGMRASAASQTAAAAPVHPSPPPPVGTVVQSHPSGEASHAARPPFWRRWPKDALNLLRDPVWGGISGVIAIGALIAGIKLAG